MTLADYITFLQGAADLFGLVLALSVGFGSLHLIVRYISQKWDAQ